MFSKEPPDHTDHALAALETWGVMLLQDGELLSLAGLIAGEPVRGSWWGHPMGHAIFNTAGELDDHPDVTSTKLVSGKVTFVHRPLWPALIAVGRERAAWQTAKLSDEARSLLDRVDEETAIRATGKVARTLQQKLLVASQQVHTESGAHAIELTTWVYFADLAAIRLPTLSALSAQLELSNAVKAMQAEFGGKAKLPWPSG